MLRANALGLSAGGRELVRALDLSLEPRQCWALLGRNGAGKTSLILALAGLREPQSGAVILDGAPLSALPRSELARRVGVLLQDEAADFWGSAFDYVMLGRYPHSRSAWTRDEEGAERARRWLADLDLAGHSAQPYRNQGQVMRALTACAAGGKTVLAALHEPGHAARHCGFSVLLYDAGRASLGRSSDMLTQANLEALYRCRLEAAGPQYFFPS